jgi:hypothetical protein
MKNSKLNHGAEKDTQSGPAEKTGKQSKNQPRAKKPGGPKTKEKNSQDGPLTDEQRRAFTRCEEILEKWLPGTVKAAKALYQIHSEKLYRTDYSSFEDYCEKRWGFKRQQGFRLAKMGQLIATLGPPGDDITSENQARLLRKVQSEHLPKVMARAKEIACAGKTELKHYQTAIDEICPEDAPKGASSDSATKNVVTIPTWADAISTDRVRQWATQALENLKMDANRAQTIELLKQIIAALTVVDNSKITKKLA